MQDQSRRLSEPLKWGRREKTVVAVMLSIVALAAIGLLAFALAGGSPARADCISLTFPSTLGGAEVHQCGGAARRTCATRGAYPHLQAELRAQCLRAGFPFAGLNT